MSFVITCREWKSLFQVKENKKKEELAKLGGKKEEENRKNEVKKKRACKSSIEKETVIKGEQA